ncbi:MAG: HD domain-containing protein [Candidatus Aminicenantaceae bacterium]
MKEDIVSLMKEFYLIEDVDLRNKTILIWEDAIRKGGWKIQDLHQMPFTLLFEKTSINILEHTRAVTLCSSKIGEVMKEIYNGKISINKDYLVSGALLHDVGKLFEYEKNEGKFVKSKEGELIRHPISGAAFASKYGIPSEIIHIIAAHSKEGDGARKTIEAVIVNHADFVNFDGLKI